MEKFKMDWLKQLMHSPIAWAVLSVLTIGSVIYAIYCQYTNKERREISYTKKTNVLIRRRKSLFEKLLITYDTREIENLCISTFTLWNSGNRTISSQDMVKTKEISVCLANNAKILDVEIIKVVETTNQFRIEKIDDSMVKIIFDYIDKKEGLVFQIMHTGSEEDVLIDCKIKGGKPIKNINNDTLPKAMIKAINSKAMERLLLPTVILIMAVCVVIAILFTVAIFSEGIQDILFISPNIVDIQKETSSFSPIKTSVVFWIFTVMMIGLYYPLIKSIYRLGIPKSLRKY